MAQLDEPYDTADRKAVPLSTMPSASDNFTHLSETDLNHNESCSITKRADFVDYFAPEERAQIVDTDVDVDRKSNPTGGYPISHTAHSEESSGHVDAEKQESASANGFICSGGTFHDTRDEMLSTAECLSYSDGKILLDELKSSEGVQQVSFAHSVGCTPSKRSCDQILEVMHSSPSNGVCPSADEESKVVANVSFAVPPVDCNASPCQANGLVAYQGMVGSDCVHVWNQESCEASKSGSEKPRLLSPTSNGHGMSCEVVPDSNKQPVDGVH